MNSHLTIIAGRYRGKKLILPDEAIARPTSNRAREALFSVIYAKYPEGFETICEPFGGSASVSFEALSRKMVKKAIVFEKDKSVIRILEKNKKAFPESIELDIREGDFSEAVIPLLGKAVIFIDPPYKDFELIEKSMKKIIPACEKGSLFICETESETPPIENPSDTRKYGRAYFYFYEV